MLAATSPSRLAFTRRSFRRLRSLELIACPKSIACARQLTERLHLTNVQFVQTDVRDLSGNLYSNKFDLVVASCVAGHFAKTVLPPVRSVEEARTHAIDPGLAEYARLLAGTLLDANSIVVSFEHNRSPIALARWLWALQDAGIRVGLDKIELLSFFDAPLNMPSSLPVLVGSKRLTTPLTAAEIRGLWTQGIREHANESSYIGAMAEAAFVAISPREFRHGFLHKLHNGRPCYRTELWESDSEVLVYHFNGNGGMKFGHGPAEELPEVTAFCETSVSPSREWGTSKNTLRWTTPARGFPAGTTFDRCPVPALACKTPPGSGLSWAGAPVVPASSAPMGLEPICVES